MTLTPVQLIRLTPDVVQQQRRQLSCMSQVLRQHCVQNPKRSKNKKMDRKMDCYHCNMFAILFYIVHFLCLTSFTPQLYGFRIHEWHVIFFWDCSLLRFLYVFNVENDMTKLWQTNTENNNIATMTTTGRDRQSEKITVTVVFTDWRNQISLIKLIVMNN